MNGIRLFGTALVIMLAVPALFAPQHSFAASTTLAPVSYMTTSGNDGGQPVANLAVQDQSGTQNNWNKYIEFTTPNTNYAGYRSYTLPTSISPAAITALQVKANYLGPRKSEQPWTWAIYDWTTSQWTPLGDNAPAANWRWTLLTFDASGTFANYVNPDTREARVRVQSGNASDNSDLDYEALIVTTATLPTSVPTNTPTSTPTSAPTATVYLPTITASPAPSTPTPTPVPPSGSADDDPAQDAPACTIYAHASYTGSSTGSATQPWNSIAQALNQASAGATICLEGAFAERAIINKSGAAGNSITIRSRFGGNRAALDLSGVSVPQGDQGAVQIINQRYIRIKNLDITGFKTNKIDDVPAGVLVRANGSSSVTGIRLIGNHIYNLGNTHGTTFTSAELQACGSTPVKSCINNDLKYSISAFGIAVKGRSTQPMQDVLIHGNELNNLITGSSESLVVNGNVDGWTVSRNLIHDNNNIGIDAIGYEDPGEFPAGFDQEQNRARNGQIVGNRVWNISSAGNPSYGNYTGNGAVSGYDRSADGMYVDGGTLNLIEGNLVINANIGIELAAEANRKSTNYNTARNNIVANVDYAALLMGGYNQNQGTAGGYDGGGSATNNVMVNNTAYTSDSASFACTEQFRVSANMIANNICAATSGKQLVIDLSDNTAATNLQPVLTGSQPNPGNLFVSVAVPSGSDLRNWDAASVQSFLHINAGSAAQNAGSTSIGGQAVAAGSTDIDGQARVAGGAIDIGADEIP